ncbi:MAG TPA: hypothetical protein VIY08_11335 [Candidatus Nitrosocosmicus sp.]
MQKLIGQNEKKIYKLTETGSKILNAKNQELKEKMVLPRRSKAYSIIY